MYILRKILFAAREPVFVGVEPVFVGVEPVFAAHEQLFHAEGKKYWLRVIGYGTNRANRKIEKLKN